MRVYILCLMFLVLVSCGIFSTGSTSHQYVQGNGVAGTKCTSHSNCLGYCDLSTDVCKDKEIGGVIISYTTKTSEADIACQTGNAYMAKSISYPVCTCSTSDNIACEEGTGTCLSTGVCSNRQASGGY